MTDELQRAAAAQSDSVLRRFFGPDGRLTTMPAKQSRKLAVFDLIAQRFVPGVRYTELEINRELMKLYDDYVSQRRGLGFDAVAEFAEFTVGATPVPGSANGRPGTG